MTDQINFIINRRVRFVCQIKTFPWLNTCTKFPWLQRIYNEIHKKTCHQTQRTPKRRKLAFCKQLVFSKTTRSHITNKNENYKVYPEALNKEIFLWNLYTQHDRIWHAMDLVICVLNNVSNW